MQLLDQRGIRIGMKKGWLAVEGAHEVGDDAIYLPPVLEFSGKAKKPLVYTLDQGLKLGSRFTAFVEYHPDLRTKGTLNGPTMYTSDFGVGNEKLSFRFMGDEDFDFTDYPWIVKLIIAKIDQ